MAGTGAATYANLATSPAQLVLLAIPGFLRTETAWFLALGLVAAASLVLWRSNFRRARAVDDTPTSRIASAHQGYVEVTGVARPEDNEVVPAPLTARPCVWYRFRIEKKGSKNKWVTETSGCSDAPFRIHDGSGSAVVDAPQAEIIVEDGRQWLAGGRRYTEWIVAQGAQVYAIGEFRSAGGGNSELDRKADVGTLLVQWKRDRTMLHERFDLDGNAALDASEWELARRAAQREVDRRHRDILSQPVMHLLGKPASGQPFLVSTLDPLKVARRHRIWQWIHLLAAVAAGGGILFLATL